MGEASWNQLINQLRAVGPWWICAPLAELHSWASASGTHPRGVDGINEWKTPSGVKDMEYVWNERDYCPATANVADKSPCGAKDRKNWFSDQHFSPRVIIQEPKTPGKLNPQNGHQEKYTKRQKRTWKSWVSVHWSFLHLTRESRALKKPMAHPCLQGIK